MINEERIWQRIKYLEDKMAGYSWHSAYDTASLIERELERIHKLFLYCQKEENK